MARKIPPDAFEFYFGLGTTRSYQAVADHYGVSKRAITKVATRDGWQQRVDEREEKAREAIDKKAVETLEAMSSRHLKSLRVIQGKALESLKGSSLKSAMDAVRALDLAIKGERLIRGEPSERTALSVEQQIREEYANWMDDEKDNVIGERFHGNAGS